MSYVKHGAQSEVRSGAYARPSWGMPAQAPHRIAQRVGGADDETRHAVPPGSLSWRGLVGAQLARSGGTIGAARRTPLRECILTRRAW